MLRDEDGYAVLRKEDKVTLLAETFFPTPLDVDLLDTRNYQYPDEISFDRITEYEIENAIRDVPANKALGPDGIPNQALIQLLPELIPHLRRLFNACINSGYCPLHFKRSTIILLRKAGKTTYNVP